MSLLKRAIKAMLKAFCIHNTQLKMMISLAYIYIYIYVFYLVMITPEFVT